MRGPDTNAGFTTACKRILTWLVNHTERLSGWVVVAMLAEITFVAVIKAKYKPLWLDEIMGLMIAKLPHSASIWSIVQSGADNQPPAYHYVMRVSVRLLGDQLGMRLPSIAGYVMFCFWLYLFVSRRTSGINGLVAMLYPGISGGWYYATEGRPYALVLACAGAAAVCWQAIAMKKKRTLMIAGLSLSLAGALNLHYYAVLLLAPFAIAESARAFRNRRLDMPVCLALIAPLLMLLIYLPVIHAGRVNSGIPDAFFARPAWYHSLYASCVQFLEPGLVPLVLVGCLYLVVRSSKPVSADRLFENRNDTAQEAALILGFIAVPFFAVVVSKFVTHIFFPRYGIPGLFGFGALVGMGISFAFGGRKIPALAIAIIFAAFGLNIQLDDFKKAKENRITPAGVMVQNRIPKSARSDNLPIVATNLDDFMQLSYYGSPLLRMRLFYVSSEALARKYLGFTFHERMMIGSAPFFGTQVVDYELFIRAHQSFYVFGALEFSQWVVPKLISDHASLQLIQGGPVDRYGDVGDVFLRAEITPN